MFRFPRFAILFLAVCLVATPLGAQELYLEPEDDVNSLQHCDTVHRIGVCETFHYSPVTTTDPGGLVKLDDTLYVITWVGPGYYLESGEVLQPLGGDSIPGLLAGQRWMEVYPAEGKIHVSRSWLDSNADGALSRADVLELETGLKTKVRDVRLNLRVRPAGVQ
jgi:hypothetical protein